MQLHWVVTVHNDKVTFRASDGRTGTIPCIDPIEYASGFCTALRLCGQTYQMLIEKGGN